MHEKWLNLMLHLLHYKYQKPTNCGGFLWRFLKNCHNR
ncbi:hypothetical protein EJK50_1510 [Moraxella catarrhalis]|nr:hypothetical protein EJK50_1510 [Moraxella catarrhalis]